MFALIREKWDADDITPFINYLISCGQPEKKQWSQNILNTPSEVLVIPTKQMYMIVESIAKGDYKSFLDLKITNYYETIAIYGLLISKMTSFEEIAYYLNHYCDLMDNWAHCDLLRFPTIKQHTQQFLALSSAYLVDKRPFVRRLGLMILFHLVKEEGYLDIIFDAIKRLMDEEAYYVIMMAGWLLSECIIIHKAKTLVFLEQNKINKKIQNKAIQKCRESRRLDQVEKDYLLAYKVK